MAMSTIEQIHIPRPMADMMRRRTQAIIVAAVHFPNALEQIAISCYAQGLADAQDLLERKAQQS